MENISPISTDGESRDHIAPLDNLLRPTQHNARASRLKHGPSRSIVSPISRNVDIGRLYLPPMSGTMTPPSQVLDDFDASRMLISPPPEETLRSTRARSTPLSSKQPPFGSSFLANPPTSTAPPASKRKRQISPTSAHKTHDAAGIREIEDSEAVHVNTTPNPKARKQSRHNVSFIVPQLASLTLDPSSSHSPRRSSPKKQVSVQSPHASNPNADFVALSPGRQHESGSVARRRSVTPLPPYEPPRERFTPPREVFRSLPPRSPAPRSSKRKPKHKLTLLIKKEPPDIDLSQPPPPASPTDDPLLLSGPPRHIKPHRNTATQGSRETPPLASTSPIRDEDMQHAFAFDAPSGGADTTMSDDFSIVPAFNFDGAVDDGFSSSEDEHEDFDQTGEYTGKFRMLAVPTKEDPPNSHTRERMEAWGRPISPFPRIIDLVNDPPSPSERKSASQPPVQDDPIAASAVVDIAENPFIEVHSPPREAQLSGNTTLDTSFDSAPDTESEDRSHAEQEQVSSRELSTSTVLGSAEPDGGPQGESPLSEAATAVMGDVSPKHKHDVLPAPQWSPLSDKTQSEDGDEDDDDDDDEAFVDRELSREPEAEDDEQVSPDTTRTDIVGETEVALQDDYDVESSDDDLEELDSGVIQVTSDDPLAAARAAAILKMHNYDCIPRSKASSRRQSQISIESLSSRRHSQLGIDAMLRSARRRSALESGISKNSPRKERRRTFGGFVGDEVVIPGSPNISLPELLKEPAPPAEHIKVAAFSRLAAQPQSFATPTKTQLALAASSRAAPEVNDKGALPSTWCKADWKLLDSCFTDERLSLGETRGLSGNSLAPVDDVDVECVADRFMQLLDGARKFDREHILQRAHALRKKQQSGKVAPPTPRREGSAPVSVASTSLSSDYPATPVTWSPTDSNTSQREPQYSRLLEEVLAESTDKPAPYRVTQIAGGGRTHAKLSRPSLAGRVKGFLFSYLPYATKTQAPPPKKPVQEHPALPAPPPDLLDKPRAPISTPAPKPALKPPHPKELVTLHHVSAQKPSGIPRPSKQPQPSVKLRPVPPPVEKRSEPIAIPRVRRDSGTSVKDLIQSFEYMQEQTELNTSTSSVRGTAAGKRPGVVDSVASKQKPVWRP